MTDASDNENFEVEAGENSEVPGTPQLYDIPCGNRLSINSNFDTNSNNNSEISSSTNYKINVIDNVHNSELKNILSSVIKDTAEYRTAHVTTKSRAQNAQFDHRKQGAISPRSQHGKNEAKRTVVIIDRVPQLQYNSTSNSSSTSNHLENTNFGISKKLGEFWSNASNINKSGAQCTPSPSGADEANGDSNIVAIITNKINVNSNTAAIENISTSTGTAISNELITDVAVAAESIASPIYSPLNKNKQRKETDSCHQYSQFTNTVNHVRSQQQPQQYSHFNPPKTHTNFTTTSLATVNHTTIDATNNPATTTNAATTAMTPLGGSVAGMAGLQGVKGGLAWVMIYGSMAQCAKTGCGLRLMSKAEVSELWTTRRVMDKDGTLDISFDEWRDYLLFHPSANLQDIILYWRHATNLDIGEDLSVPDDFSQEEWVSGKWWRHLVAGGFAGMVSRTCTAPLDRLKVFLQVHGVNEFKSLRSCFSYMVKEGGVRSLWRGNGINVIKIAPESALKFMAYEQAKAFIMQNFGDPNRELSIYERFAAGSFAGGFSQTIIYPMEVLKIRLALRKSGQYKSIADATRKIYQIEGFRSFYRGYLPNLLGIIPYAGIDLAVYETLKGVYSRRSGKSNSMKDPSIFVIIGCGGVSSTCGQVASYPLALIRTRLQAQVLVKNRSAATEAALAHPSTMVGLFRYIIKNEGLRGLYRGITPNFMKVAPAVSISYVVYEKSRQALGVTMT